MAPDSHPPPYDQSNFVQLPRIEDAPNRPQIRRKPVPSQGKETFSSPQHVMPLTDGRDASERSWVETAKLEEDKKFDAELEAPRLPPRPNLSLETSTPTHLTDSSRHMGLDRTSTGLRTVSASTGYGYRTLSPDSFPSPTISSTSTDPETPSSSQSSTALAMKKAYQEARYFAGGLIHHPYESTKHFTILRHSHGLVFYQGTSTSLAISIFADALLPPDRTLWLQSKGWSGKTGMRARAFIGRNGNWLNVTPTRPIMPDQLNPNDERAWQRDIQKFRKKAKPNIRERQQLRETCVVHIPAAAGDGYFQLVLCSGEKKKVLCYSPVFRVLSTSLSPSSIRGASLSTLPLELGAFALTTYAHITAATATATAATAVSTFASPFQSRVQQYMPSFWTRQAASVAYEITGVQDKLASTAADTQSHYQKVRDRSIGIAGDEQIEVEEGPRDPYPVRFIAGCVAGMNEVDQLDLPIARLSIPENVSLKLYGHYFGWARSFVKQGTEKSSLTEISWLAAIISATSIDTPQLSSVNVKQARTKNFTLRIIEEADENPFQNGSVEVQVMGLIRPDEPANRANMEHAIQAGDEAAVEASVLAEVHDVSMAQGILDHPSWAPDTIERGEGQEEKTGKLDALKKGYADTRLSAQEKIDRIPFHKVGLRVPVDLVKGQEVTMDGFYVVR